MGELGHEGLCCLHFRARQLGWKLVGQEKLLQFLQTQGNRKRTSKIWYFRTSNYPVPRKHGLNPSAALSSSSSRFYTQKGILRLHFSTTLFITEKAKESKAPSFMCFFNCIADLCQAHGATGSQDANKYPTCQFITCEGWGPEKLAARRSVNPVNDISNAVGCCRAKQ